MKGGEALVAEALPNVAFDLASHKSIKILSIGASAAAGRRSTRGGYTRLIEQILERAVKGIDVTVINRGVSGELAANAASRIKTEVAFTHPDLVLCRSAPTPRSPMSPFRKSAPASRIPCDGCAATRST